MPRLIRRLLVVMAIPLMLVSLPVQAQPEPTPAEAGDLVLSHAYPNPFAQQTSFDVVVERPQSVRVEVFDLLGQRIATLFDGPVEAGEVLTLTFEGDDMAPGIYLYRVTGEDATHTRRVVRTP